MAPNKIWAHLGPIWVLGASIAFFCSRAGASPQPWILTPGDLFSRELERRALSMEKVLAAMPGIQAADVELFATLPTPYSLERHQISSAAITLTSEGVNHSPRGLMSFLETSLPELASDQISIHTIPATVATLPATVATEIPSAAPDPRVAKLAWIAGLASAIALLSSLLLARHLHSQHRPGQTSQ